MRAVLQIPLLRCARKCAQDCARQEVTPGEPGRVKLLRNEDRSAADLPGFARLADPKSGASANSATFALSTILEGVVQWQGGALLDGLGYCIFVQIPFLAIFAEDLEGALAIGNHVDRRRGEADYRATR
jgi:hypothetical protein